MEPSREQTGAGRYGLLLPGLTQGGSHIAFDDQGEAARQSPEQGAGIDNDWVRDNTPEDMALIAKAAERLGYDHLACAEHVGVPPEATADHRRGARYYDPLPAFGYLSAVTSRIRFLTYVLVLGLHHPLSIAKQYGTLDRICGGRLVLGVGLGALKQEFDVLGLGGAEYVERGPRADDALLALRAALGRRMPTYEGPYYSFGNLIIDPCAIQQEMPIWIGGISARSLRRAIELGDGWIPYSLSVAEQGEMIARAKDTPAWHARSKPIELVFRHEGYLDPVGEPGLAADQLGVVFQAGGTMVNVGFMHRSRAHFVEQMEALADLKV